MNALGGSSYSMLTGFIVDWRAETTRWVDKQIQVACAESPANKALVTGWFNAVAERDRSCVGTISGRCRTGRG